MKLIIIRVDGVMVLVSCPFVFATIVVAIKVIT